MKRGDNNQDWLFELAGNWLTLQNIIIDVAKQTYTGTPTSTLIYTDGQSVLTLDGAVLQNNKAPWGGAILCSNSTNAFNQIIMRGTAAIRNNETDTGGGLSVRNATVNMEGGTIQDNSAHREGGGVSLESGGVLRQTRGDIYGNSANCGGGVYVGPEAVYTQTDGSVGAGGFNTVASAPGVCNEGVFELEGSRYLENGLWIDSRNAAP